MILTLTYSSFYLSRLGTKETSRITYMKDTHPVTIELDSVTSRVFDGCSPVTSRVFDG